MVETADGQKLLQLLFRDDNQDNSLTSKGPPTEQQIAALFSKMDSNRDNVSHCSLLYCSWRLTGLPRRLSGQNIFVFFGKDSSSSSPQKNRMK
jgi:hypothetical protein